MSAITPQMSSGLVPLAPQNQPGDVGQLPDILGPLPLPEPFPWLPSLAAVAVLALVALVLFIWFRRRKNPLPQVPPWQYASTRLEHLRELRQAGETLAFLDGISLLLRDYLERRFGWCCSSTTTEEFFQRHREADWPLSRSSRESLRHCLETCDLAKYAQIAPAAEILDQVEMAVQSFIAATSQQPGEGR